MTNETEYDGTGVIKKADSRKWRLVIYILVISIIGTFAPPLLSLWLFKAASPLFILTGGEFVTLVTLIVSAYFGANVWQKHVLKGEVSIDTSNEKAKTNVTASVESETKVEPNEHGEA